MKNNIYKSFLIVASIGLFAGCKPNLTAPSPSKGNIDVTRYVAIGNSITSGFADGALYHDGQMVSYPNLIAQQFVAIGGGDFKQPLMPGTLGCGTADSSGHTIFVAPFKLGYSIDCKLVTSLAPIPSAGSGDKNALFTSVQGPFNNMGVPGAKVIDIATQGYGTPNVGNPFFTRMASNPATASILSDAMLIKPTFFSLFIGNNDVLLYATNGGASPATITSQATFSASITALVDSLTKHGAKGVIANIPDVTVLPFFTTIPWNALTLTQSQADSLNIAWADNSTTPPTPLYNFKAGNNGFLIKDPMANPFLPQRLIKEGEFVLLDVPLNSIKCNNLGSKFPIPNQYILTSYEIDSIKTAISGYNTIIKAVADKYNLAFVDVNAFLNQTKTGFAYDGVTFNAAFVTGGTFSLDGVHLTPVGNALLANEFIKSINAKFGSTVNQVDVSKYHGVIFP